MKKLNRQGAKNTKTFLEFRSKKQFQQYLGDLCARLPQCIRDGGQVLVVFFFPTLLE
jgi:CRISPR/Cas system CMR-associated protein Cmr5 small subunit